ncbi:unnamed protein product [Arabis nemorensis]|uniref:OTU domain-containing protein n=1 Tax=Arabis nemorensis TaxID=586526 RepID=A0A565AUN5_9BRAS|nr:unnamed protein product [Arabis nemorensis]
MSISKEQLRKDVEIFESFLKDIWYSRQNFQERIQPVEGDPSLYLENMSSDGYWGDHITLQAAANLFGVVINVLDVTTSTSTINLVEIRPQGEQNEDPPQLWISLWDNLHYTSLEENF